MKRSTEIVLPLFVIAVAALGCASGSESPIDITLEEVDETVEAEEGFVDDVNDVAEEGEAAAGDLLENDAEMEDLVADDQPTEEPADPCSPNPCTEPPGSHCLPDGTTLRYYDTTGTCTPSEEGYECIYGYRDTDCTATGGMVCIEGDCTNTIEQVRAAPDGPVGFDLKGVYVTYVRSSPGGPNGFYIQKEQQGPGLYIHLGTVSPSVSPGNMLNLRINRVSSFHGLKEVNDFTILYNDRVARDVTFLVQDFSGGGVIDENTESELIRINGAQVVSGWVNQYRVTFGASSATNIYYTGFSALTPRVCPGMVINILSPAGEWNGSYRLNPHADTDFLLLDNSACAPIDNSNWDFEEWTYSDPPEDFEKRNDTFTVVEERAVVNSGTAAANLTWRSVTSPDFYQAWYTPVVAGTTYTFRAWFYDSDTGGRSRIAITPYDENLRPGPNSFDTLYSDDSTPAWQEFDVTLTPQASGFIRGFVRMYDEATGWDGSATNYLDDWAITVRTPFAVTDGRIDTWATTDPPSVPLVAGTPSVTMEVYTAINDEGILYVATHEAAVGGSDHFLYVWLGGASHTATVPAPWAKAGTVAAPAASSYLLALIQEEGSGYCEVRRWNGSAWVAAASASCGYDGTANGTGYLEATLNLPTALRLSRVTQIPAMIGVSVAPYGTTDGGTLISSSQVPPCRTPCNGNVDPVEISWTHRARLLVGNVRP